MVWPVGNGYKRFYYEWSNKQPTNNSNFKKLVTAHLFFITFSAGNEIK